MLFRSICCAFPPLLAGQGSLSRSLKALAASAETVSSRGGLKGNAKGKPPLASSSLTSTTHFRSRRRRPATAMEAPEIPPLPSFLPNPAEPPARADLVSLKLRLAALLPPESGQLYWTALVEFVTGKINRQELGTVMNRVLGTKGEAGASLSAVPGEQAAEQSPCSTTPQRSRPLHPLQHHSPRDRESVV